MTKVYENTLLVGGYVGKPYLLNAITKYELALKMIAFVHYRGTYKYPAYGWFNNPYDVGGSTLDDLNAMLRHYGAHSQGKLIDPEGLPHLFHLACRAGMLVTTFTQEHNPTQYRIKNNTIGHHASEWTKFITHEEILSLSKKIIVPENIEELQAEMLPKIVAAAEYVKSLPHEEIDFTEDHATPLDILFRHVVTYCQNLWKEEGTLDLILDKVKTNDPEWIEFFNTGREHLTIVARPEAKIAESTEKTTWKL